MRDDNYNMQFKLTLATFLENPTSAMMSHKYAMMLKIVLTAKTLSPAQNTIIIAKIIFIFYL